MLWIRIVGVACLAISAWMWYESGEEFGKRHSRPMGSFFFTLSMILLVLGGILVAY
jgi:uncharacterized membrane protein YidH (DUF202 family)